MDLTALQYHVLRTLQKYPEGLGMQALDRRMIRIFSPTVVSRDLGACFTDLTRMGLIARTERHVYGLTPMGKECLDQHTVPPGTAETSPLP